MPSWLIWLIAAGGLAAAETLSLDLVLIMLAGGAGAGALTAAVGGPPWLQWVVAIAGALALLGVVRPVARRHMLSGDATVTGTAALVGKTAVALTEIDEHDGRVRLNGAEWSARTYQRGHIVPVGTTVRVLEITGATAVVWEEQL